VSQLAILGAGSWGTALALALTTRFETVRLWSHDATRAHQIQWQRENKRYLPGFRLPYQVTISNSLTATLAESDMVLCVVPSRYLRSVLQEAAPFIDPSIPVVSATKGIEDQTLIRMSEVAAEVLGTPERIAVLSGPTFAREVAAGEPAAVVIAADRMEVAAYIQHVLATRTLRLYASLDVVGVEIGAALKNVIAIGTGVCRGLGLGSNSSAALITRGLAEITRLALVMGGSPRTLSGLAGLGDLVLTATGDLSRNRAVGYKLGQGLSLPEILATSPMVAEGIPTCRAAYELGVRHGVDLPIVQRMFQVLYENKDPRAAIRELMDRPLTSE
jgi:glycerol-3-phosphate dehydrogenase (NAD(P)+)